MVNAIQKSNLGRVKAWSHTLCQHHVLPSVLNKCSVMVCGISEGAAIPKEVFQDVLGGKLFRLPAFDVKQNKYLRKCLLLVCIFIILNTCCYWWYYKSYQNARFLILINRYFIFNVEIMVFIMPLLDLTQNAVLLVGHMRSASDFL